MPHNKGQADKRSLKKAQLKKGPPKQSHPRKGPPRQPPARKAPLAKTPPKKQTRPAKAPAAETQNLDPAKESKEAIKTAARLDHVLSKGQDTPAVAGGQPAPSAGAAANQALLKSVRHQYKHALEAIHRQAALTGDANAKAQEEMLKRLFSEFALANGASEATKAAQKASEIRELAKGMVEDCEKHDHREKKELKKLVAERGNDQDLLAGSSAQLMALPEFSKHAELIAACDAYATLLAQGQKNSADNEQALDRLLASLDKLPADLPENAMKLVASIKKAARDEKERVTKARQTVERAVSGKGPIKFAETSASGDSTTTKAQNEALRKMITEQTERSNVFAKLLDEVMASPQELEMITGRGSCGLFDSFMEGTVDTAHFGILPSEPVTVNDKKVGLTQSEILVHVLEERLYSRQRAKDDQQEFGKCTDYDHAHNKCLAPGSYQNLYRREQGVDSDTLQLTTGKTKDGHSGFQHLSSDGAISTTPIGGINSPDFKPDPARFEYDAEDRDGYAYVMERFKKGLELKFRNGKLVGANGKFDRSKLDASATKDWKIWLTEQTGDAKKADSVVEGIVAELGEKYEKLYADEAKRVKEQTGKANDLLSAKPDKELSTGSLDLRNRRQARGDGQVNDAVSQYRAWQDRRGKMTEAERLDEDKRLPKVTDTSRVNCAVTTLGAITGGNSTKVVQDYFDSCDRKDLKDTCGGLQGDDMWAFVEEGRVPEPIPNDDDHLREQLSGDAQLRGIRTAMLAEAKKRGSPYKVVQDGLNEHGGMYPPDKLVEQMSKYPDGTQFQIFTNGDMRHWVYAEMFDGQVVIEDHQMSSTEGKGEPPTAKLATDGKPPKPAKDAMPDNPLSGVGGSFTEGMFLAITPVADRKDLPPRATDPNWPEPGTDADKKLSTVIAELAKQAVPADFAGKLKELKAKIEDDWCNVAEVVNAISEAVDAFEGLKKPRSLSEPASSVEPLFQKHAQAVPKIKAQNKQLDRLLQAKVVSKLRYAPQPTVLIPSDNDGLVSELRKAQDKFNAASLIAAYGAHNRDKAWLKTPDKWTPANADTARKLLETINAAIADVKDLAIPGLKPRLQEFVFKLGLAAAVKRYEKRMKVAECIPDAPAFLQQMDQTPQALAVALGRDQFSDEEEAELAVKRGVLENDKTTIASTKQQEMERSGDLQRVAQGLPEREAALKGDAPLNKKKAEFDDKLKALVKEHKKAQSEIAALKPPPEHQTNVVAKAEAALADLERMLGQINDSIVQAQLKAALYLPLEADLQTRRPTVKAKIPKPAFTEAELEPPVRKAAKGQNPEKIKQEDETAARFAKQLFSEVKAILDGWDDNPSAGDALAAKLDDMLNKLDDNQSIVVTAKGHIKSRLAALKNKLSPPIPEAQRGADTTQTSEPSSPPLAPPPATPVPTAKDELLDRIESGAIRQDEIVEVKYRGSWKKANFVSRSDGKAKFVLVETPAQTVTVSPSTATVRSLPK